MKRRNRLPAIIRLVRPHQWSKNAVVLAGVVFSGQARDPAQLVNAVVAAFAFCTVSGAVYAFNDWHDRAEDRLHPVKRRRPVASGAVTPPFAFGLGGVLVIAACLVALTISAALAGIILAYACLMLAYTLWFRRIAVLDVLTISVGFVLRALAGAVAVAVPLSMWLFVCTLLLALMLGLGKRRHELRMLGGANERRRPSLPGYARLDLDRLMIGVAILTAGSYVLYALAGPAYGRQLAMIVTAPFVLAAIGRYLILVFRRNLGGAPEALVVHDRLLFLLVLAWALATGLVLAS